MAGYRKLGRTSSQRKALLRNQVTDLLCYGKIKTTEAKAENEENMQWFEEHFPFGLESLDSYVPEKVRNEHTKAGWIQILPGQYQSDGFFIARFRRSRDEGAE